MARNVFITCHYSTHGIAFLKHILSWFYENNTVKPPSNVIQNLEQESLNDVFDKSKGESEIDVRASISLFAFKSLVYLFN